MDEVIIHALHSHRSNVRARILSKIGRGPQAEHQFGDEQLIAEGHKYINELATMLQELGEVKVRLNGTPIQPVGPLNP